MRAFLCLFLFLSLPARAVDMDDAVFYHDAIKAGRAAGDADGFAAACRAGLSLGGFYETGEIAVMRLHGAIDDCRKALGLAPHHTIASISYGIGLSFESKRIHKAGLAKLAKERFEALVEEKPDNALAHGALGGWHAHVAASGFMARMVLGASRKTAEEEFARSLALAKPDRPLLLEYIKFLAGGDKRDRAAALALMPTYHALPVTSPLDRLMDERSRKLEDALRADDKGDIKDALPLVSAFWDIADWDSAPALTEEDVAY
ncbi:MAG: hypothetical protein EP335_16130 [Alphaproteobacteria bacterium]|nr:MAG: hypothetical protein EP335_16130 [Alphaproteobacteria bacterium]